MDWLIDFEALKFKYFADDVKRFQSKNYDPRRDHQSCIVHRYLPKASGKEKMIEKENIKMTERTV